MKENKKEKKDKKESKKMMCLNYNNSGNVQANCFQWRWEKDDNDGRDEDDTDAAMVAMVMEEDLKGGIIAYGMACCLC